MSERVNMLPCPWCHAKPKRFEVPRGTQPGDPVMCPLCGRWSLLTLNGKDHGLVRANTEMRTAIRLMPEAQVLREHWRQKVLRGRENG